MAFFSAIGAIATAIGAGIGALTGGFIAVSGLTVLKTAVGIGLNLLAAKIAGKQKNGATASFSVKGQLQSGGTVSRSIILGLTATAGSLSYANSWGTDGGTPNAYFTQVIALADYPVQGLAGVLVNGVYCELDGDNPHPEYGWPVLDYRRNGSDYMWIKFYDGWQTTADSFLVSRVSSSDRPYENTRVGYGEAYAIATSRLNSELFTGFPSFKFVVQGAALYDPTKDTTAGGDGPQRWSDPATWGGDGDHLAAVQAYNLLRGIRWNGQWLYGLQSISERRLPAAHWRGQNAICRALIEGPDGMEPSYRSGAEVAVNAPLRDALEGILTAGIGRISEIGGVYKAYFGAPGEPVMHFTDDDILSTEKQSFTPFFGIADTVNGITANYPSPDDGWNMAAAPALYRFDYEAQDGNRRLLAAVDLDFVPYKGQVQRLIQAALAEARRARRHTLMMPPSFWPLEPGDIVTWTSARNGYVTKRFRVDGVNDLPNLDVILDLTEVDPEDFAWDQAKDYRPPASGSLSPGWPTPQVMTGWTVAPASIDGKAPAILVGCASGMDDVARVWVQVRLKETGAVVFDSDSSVYAYPYSWLLSGGWCLSKTRYEVRGKYVAISQRPTEWSSWLEVETGEFSLDLIADLAHIGEDAKARLRELQADLDSARDRLERITVDLSLNAASGEYARERIVQEMGVARAELRQESLVRADENQALTQLYTGLFADFSNNAAAVQQTLTALANEDEALAEQVTQLFAETAQATAAIQQEQTTRTNEVAALASSITNVNARVDGVDAQGYLAITAQTSGATLSKIELAARATLGDQAALAAFVMEVINDGGVLKTQNIFYADRTIFVAPDGTGGQGIVEFGPDGARLAVADCGRITAGEIEIGKVLINSNGIKVSS